MYGVLRMRVIGRLGCHRYRHWTLWRSQKTSAHRTKRARSTQYEVSLRWFHYQLSSAYKFDHNIHFLTHFKAKKVRSSENTHIVCHLWLSQVGHGQRREQLVIELAFPLMWRYIVFVPTEIVAYPYNLSYRDQLWPNRVLLDVFGLKNLRVPRGSSQFLISKWRETASAVSHS